MPDEAEKLRRQAADGRYVAIEHTQVSFVGTSRVHGELDLADALDLETPMFHGAAVLAACGSEETPTCAAPRPWASSPATRPHWTSKQPTPRPSRSRQTVVHVHLSPDGPFARVQAYGPAGSSPSSRSARGCGPR